MPEILAMNLAPSTVTQLKKADAPLTSQLILVLEVWVL